MPPPLDVDRNQVKMMVQQYGCTETAARTGIPLNTVLSWSARGNWLAELRKPTLPASIAPTALAIGAIKPVDAMQNALIEDGKETRSHGMRYARLVTAHAAKKAETSPDEALAEASNVKQALQTAAIAGSWASGESSAATVVNIALIGMKLEG